MGSNINMEAINVPEYAGRECSISISDQIKLIKNDVPAADAGKLEKFADLFTSLVVGLGLPTPYIYPSKPGNVRAEWSGVDWEVTLDVNLQASTASALAVGIHESSSFTLVSLSHPASVNAFGVFMRTRGITTRV